ncbi:MAG: DUF3999 domain-containing protein [Rhodocyclales bacterium]|nr:DUF3999 domain-containing protein [Rhodocyclales bacterium]
MKAWPWMVLLIAPAALAEVTPQDFDVRLAIEAPADAGLVQLRLPADVYRAVRRADLGDVRIFNGAGEPVPMARLPRRTEARERRVERPLVSVPGMSVGTTESVVVDKVSASGSVRIEIDAGSNTPVAAAPRGYLLEVKDFDVAVDELALIWPEPTPFEAAVTVRASDDLQNWRNVARRTPVLALGAGDARIVQDRIALPAVRARFLRVDWDGAPPAITLQRAALVSRSAATAIERGWVEVDGAYSGGAVEYVSPGLFPVDALRLVPPGDNDVVSAVLFSRATVSARWQWRGATVGYRLRQADGTLEGTPTPVALSRDPLWRATLATDMGEGSAPRLQLGWVSEEVAFVARGAGPYTLAAGHATTPPAWLAPAQVVPGYGSATAATLHAGQVLSGAQPVSPPPRTPAPWQPGSHWLLWAALMAGVGVLGMMARGLWRDMRAPERREP